jgi:hypothetical protein
MVSLERRGKTDEMNERQTWRETGLAPNTVPASSRSIAPRKAARLWKIDGRNRARLMAWSRCCSEASYTKDERRKTKDS